LVLAGLAARAPTLAEAHDNAQFRPTGPWSIDYADESCRLIRNFSDGHQDMSLYLVRYLPGPYIRLGVAGNTQIIGRSRPTAKYRYSADKKERISSLLEGQLGDGRKIVFLRSADILDAIPTPEQLQATEGTKLSWLVNEELAAARTVDSVELDGKFDFQLGPMEAPIKQLQSCIADLVTTSWGLDMNRMLHMSVRAKPLNNPQTWISSSDYPPEMLKARLEGVVAFRLIIDPQGSVSQCFVDVDKQGPFQISTCNAVKKHARFSPALDADGKPMPAIYTCSVQFRLF
jgi:hypothetical protein